LAGYAEQSKRRQEGDYEEGNEDQPRASFVRMLKPEIRSHKNMSYELSKSEPGYSVYIKELGFRMEWFEEKNEAVSWAQGQIREYKKIMAKRSKKKSKKGKK
jgi:hypothetical protein